MPLEFVTSQKGCQQLLFQGFKYNFEKAVGPKKIWRCSAYFSKKCRGRVFTVADKVYVTQEHCHRSDLSKIHACQVMAYIKSEALRCDDSAVDIIARSTRGLNEAVVARLPPFELMKRNIQNIRQRKAPIARGL